MCRCVRAEFDGVAGYHRYVHGQGFQSGARLRPGFGGMITAIYSQGDVQTDCEQVLVTEPLSYWPFLSEGLGRDDETITGVLKGSTVGLRAVRESGRYRIVM